MVHFCRRKQPEARRARVPLNMGKTSSLIRCGRGKRTGGRQRFQTQVCSSIISGKTQDTPLLGPDSLLKTINQSPFLESLVYSSITVGRRMAVQIRRECDCLAVGYRSSLNAFRVLPCNVSCLTMCGPGGDRYQDDLQNYYTVVLTHPHP